MKNLNLSKSSFIRGLQCSKSLYLYKKFYSLRDRLSPETLSKFSRGQSVGLLAQQLFPEGINLRPFSPQQYSRSVERTKGQMLNGTKTIYEAAFSFNNVLVFLDILHFEDGGWHAYEVKSSIEVSETYIMDASLQYYVISNSGVELASFDIIYINKEYVRTEKVDVKQLFKFKDVLQDALNNLSFIQNKVEEFQMLLSIKNVPEVKIGQHCNHPYTCDFIGHCWKEVPKHGTIFSIPSFSDDEKFALYDKGICLAEDIPSETILSGIQKLQMASCIKKVEYVDVPGLKEYFSNFKFPVMIADLQSCCPALPRRDNTRPYQYIPYMVHVGFLDEEGKDLKSLNFFQEDISRQTSDFCKNLCNIFEEASSIFVVDKKYFLLSLATFVSDGFMDQSHHDMIKKKTFDSKTVFRNNFYFNPVLSPFSDLQSIAKGIFKMRISRNLISSNVVASDMYDSLQSETDMFHIVEIKEKLNEYAAFNIDVLKRFFIYLRSKSLS